MKPAALVLLLVALGLSACNTVKGMGKDVSTAGDTVTHEAQKTENNL